MSLQLKKEIVFRKGDICIAFMEGINNKEKKGIVSINWLKRPTARDWKEKRLWDSKELS